MSMAMDPTAHGSGGTVRTPSKETVAHVDAKTRARSSGDPRHQGSAHSRTERASGAAVSQGRPDDPPITARIARFTVLERIGRGGMGTVYAAYDEQLDRKIAVKVLPEHELPDEEDRARFQREAQALARLSHPNVVTVHEVGDADGRLFLAMEFIHGQDLARWLCAEPNWRVVLDAFVQAGKGLAAVHEAGLIHRDLKPHNIMRRDDGVVKILDFGLARAASEAFEPSLDEGTISTMSSSSGSGSGSGSSSSLSGSLTRPGTVLGTPAYMSPEQFYGEAIDARSDQFSFCVALYEGIYGERPFVGDTIKDLCVSIRDGRIRPEPRDRPAPARLRAVLRRGLAADPGARWPSMDALLEQLQRLLAPRRGRWLPLSASLALGLGLVGVAIAYRADVEQRCTGARDQLGGVWDDARRQTVEAAILGTEVSYAPSTWTRVQTQLDAYADAWMSKHTDVCEATVVRQEQSEEAMALRMRCLGQRRSSLRAAADVLADADAEVVANAVKLAAGLPSLSRCDDVDWLEQQDQLMPPPEDPDVVAEVEQLRERLAQIAVMHEAGRYAEALEQAEPVVQRAEARGYPPLRAEAYYWRGELRNRTGAYTKAEQDLLLAHSLAVEHHHDVVMLDAAQSLTYVVGYNLARHEAGQQWGLTAALPLARRSGDPAELATSLSNLGATSFSRGEYEDAKEYQQQALVIRQQVLGNEHPKVADVLNNLGNTYLTQGKPEDASGYYQRALAIQQETLGGDHPDVARTLYNLGSMYLIQGEYEDAKEYLGRALTIWTEALGADHPHVARALSILANVLSRQGEYADAEEHHRRALEIRRRALGDDHPLVAGSLVSLGNMYANQRKYLESVPMYRRALEIQRTALGAEHPHVATTLNNLGAATKNLGEYEQALAYHEQALEIRQEVLGPEHREVAMSLHNLGSLYGTRGDHEEARKYLQRAVEIRQSALGPDSPTVAISLAVLATAAMELGDVDSARAHAERAISNWEAVAFDPTEIAKVRFLLAQALWSEPRERARAHALAEQARETLATRGDPDAPEPTLAKIDAWLATHRVSRPPSSKAERR